MAIAPPSLAIRIDFTSWWQSLDERAKGGDELDNRKCEQSCNHAHTLSRYGAVSWPDCKLIEVPINKLKASIAGSSRDKV